MTTRWHLTILLTIVLLSPSLAAGSDTRAAVITEPRAAGEGAARTFGTLSMVAHTINANEFIPNDSSVTYTSPAGRAGSRHLTSPGFWRAPVHLPAGVSILGLELQACDTSASGALTAVLRGGGVFIAGTQALEEITYGVPVSTGVGAVPNCGYFFAPYVQPPVLDNVHRTHYVEVTQDTTDGSNTFQGVRLYYRLQVSPAPATATFLDVPKEHPFFQFVEALAAAGITGGCSPPPLQYCPDDFVTRGQMAVFLSRALGLHFAP